MKKMFRTLRHRMSWTNAKKLLNSAGISTSHGWDGTLKKLDASPQKFDIGKIEDGLVQHILCGEKYTKLYKIDPSVRDVLQAAMKQQEPADVPAYHRYPHLMKNEDLWLGSGDIDVVQVESNEDGIGLVLSSVLMVKTREEIPFTEFEHPKDMQKRYEEVIGLVRQPVQMFHVIWVPHHRDFMEIRVDYPKGIPEADVHGIHSVLKGIVNSWGIVQLDKSVNLFPAVRPFYDDPNEGTVTQMTFQTTTGGIKDEKMPRRRLNADQRKEPYHVAGKGAVEAIAIYKITVEWGFSEDDQFYQPAISLSASGPSGQGEGGNPIITGALIRDCVRTTDYEFVIERLGKKAQFLSDPAQE
ncbi:hypothetical protein [Roseovarius mucosus]|uniref:hypothetical protein n=1 Tax=Roseovarius mucosus TaxID=215743 RepID=UPI003F6F43D4